MGKACLQCGTTFNPRRETQHYCSRPCARAKNGGHNRKPETWWVDRKGYIQGRVWVGSVQRRVKQHRWVMERHLGRELCAHEDVHHLDGNKQNNAVANLQVISRADHTRITNGERIYTRGKKIRLSDEERARRSKRMAERHAAALSRVSPNDTELKERKG